MDSQLFDQFLEDRWSSDLCESKPLNTEVSGFSCPDYAWLNEYKPMDFDSSDFQLFTDLNSYTKNSLASPDAFTLPSPISEVSSPSSAEDNSFLFSPNTAAPTNFINPWLNPNTFNAGSTSPNPATLPFSSSPSTPSLSLASSSASTSPSSCSISEDTIPEARTTSYKSSSSSINMRTRKSRDREQTSSSSKVNKSSSTSSKSSTPTSPIHKRPSSNNSHNLIEKRYRNNLNSKISALRDCIPSLSSSQGIKSEEDPLENDDDSTAAGERGRTPKCNKGTILDKAIQYIHELERDVKRLERENGNLRVFVKGRGVPDYLMMGLTNGRV